MAVLNKDVFFLEMPETPIIIKGVYENKIRRSSPIEKIFEVFATVKGDDSSLKMSIYDFMRAICPFNFSTKPIDDLKSYVKDNPPQTLIKLFDLDKSNSLSVYEFYIFWVFHDISVPELENKFEALEQPEAPPGSGMYKGHTHKRNALVSKEELKKFLEYQGSHSKVALVDTVLPDGRHAKVTKTDFQRALNEFIEGLYAGKEAMPLKDLLEVKRQIRDDIYAFEFNTFPVKENGTIGIEDFAKCIISYSSRVKAKQYLKALQEHPLPEADVTLEEFKAFKEFIADDLEQLTKIMEDSGVMGIKKFEKILKQLSEDNVYKISDAQYKALFSILDENHDGRVSFEEFSSLLKNAQRLGRSVESNAVNYSMAPVKDLRVVFWTWVDKLQRIAQIIKE